MNNLAVAEKQEVLELSESLGSRAEQFINSLDAKDTTKNAYRKSLKVFQAWTIENNITSPDRETILEYKQYLQARDLSPQTITAYLTALRRFFAYLESIKVYPNIAKDIKGLKRPRGFMKDALTKDEVNILLEGIARKSLTDLRDYALINLMLRTGLRTIEVSRALIEDIGREGGEQVLRVWGKGRDSKDELVILTLQTYKPILEYLEARRVTKRIGPLFISHSNRSKEALATGSISRIIANRLKDVGLKTDRITAHSLRHTAGTIALSNGADLIGVKDMLRHSNINTTMIYTHNLNRISNGAEKFISFN